MSLRTYRKTAEYRELNSAPLFNAALVSTPSSQRYQELRQRQMGLQAGRNLTAMKLAGGGEISFVAPASDDRSKFLAAQAEMKRRGIKRPLVMDVKSPNANFDGVDLKGAVITGRMPASMKGANAEGATFHQVGGGTVAPRANFRNATFRDANLTGTQARDANFDGAKMIGNVDATRLDAPGSSWRGAKASGIRLTYANLSGAKFENTDFSNAEAARANLGGAKGSVNLSGAKAQGISMRYARLNLTAPNADLKLGDLMGAELNNPNFNNASLDKKAAFGVKVASLDPVLAPEVSSWANNKQPKPSYAQRAIRAQSLVTAPAPV